MSAFYGRRYRGALVKKAADQNTADYTAGAAIAWDEETYDQGGFHDNVTNNSRLTIPAGVSKVRVSAQAYLTNLTADMYVQLQITKGGSPGFTGMGGTFQESGGGAIAQASTAVVQVSAGDYFEAQMTVETDNSITVLAARSWFAVEVIE